MTIDLRKPQQPEQSPSVRVPDAHTQRAPSEIARARTRPTRKKENALMMLAVGVAGLVVVLLLGYGITRAWGYFFGGSEREVRALVSDVSNHMLLPENETPNVATVSDMHALEGQVFFKNAELGDKVLMYMVSQKAIIYRPSIDRIIEVGPITGSAQ